MSEDSYDFYDDREAIWCDRCQGSGVAECYCGGDQCYCENNGEMECRRCGGQGSFIPKPGQLEREAEEARQMREILSRSLPIDGEQG